MVQGRVVMPEPTGKQFVHILRGLKKVEPGEIDYNRLGMHWTTNRDVADYFAYGNGSIVEGFVHRNNLITPDHPDWNKLSEKHGIFGPTSKEFEQTIRPGSPIQISKVHHVWDDDYEPLTYEPEEPYDEFGSGIVIPREGKA